MGFGPGGDGWLLQLSLGFETRFWPSDFFDAVCPDCYLPEIWVLRPAGAPAEVQGAANHFITAFISGDRADQVNASPILTSAAVII